ncbi:MAG TPA: hypothetical protein PKH28_02175 [Candidatus Competibacteraceae bacterium]|nr:hypothetical protein [Candidatus Competibacteraceae bacterium]
MAIETQGGEAWRDLDSSTDSITEQAALIGLGSRGCEQLQRLCRAGLENVTAFLIDHDSAARRADDLPVPSCWIGNTETVADFAACTLLGLVIMGVDHQEGSEWLSLRLGLLRERPMLLLGIVLPAAPVVVPRRRPERWRELDSVIEWPALLNPAADLILLRDVVDDLIRALLDPDPLGANFAEMLAVFGDARTVYTASLEVDPAATAAWAPETLDILIGQVTRQGLDPQRTLGLLVVVRGGDAAAGAALRALLEQRLPQGVLLAVAVPDAGNPAAGGVLRVTLFATTAGLAISNVARRGLST